MSNLVNIRAGSDFVFNVLKHFEQIHENIDDYTLIFPTTRLKKVFFEKYYQSKKSQALKFPESIVISELDIGYFLFNSDNDNIKESVDKNYRTFWLADAVKDFFDINGEEKSYKDIYDYSLKIGEIFDDALKYDVDFESLKDVVKNADLALNWQKTSAFLSIIYNEWQKHLISIDKIEPVKKQTIFSEKFAKIIKNNKDKYAYIGYTGNITGDKYILDSMKKNNDSIVFLYCADFSYNEKEISDIRTNITHPLNSIYNNIVIDDFDNNFEYMDNEDNAKFLKYMFYPSNHTIKWNKDKIKTLDNVEIVETKNDEEGIVSLIVREALENKNEKIGIVTPDRVLVDKIKSILQIWNIECDDSVAENLFDNEETIFLRLIIDVIKNNFSRLSFISLIKNKYFNLGKNKLYIKRISGLIEINFLKRLNINPNKNSVEYLKSLDKEEAEEIAKSVRMDLQTFNECVDFIDEAITIFYDNEIKPWEKNSVIFVSEKLKNICNLLAPMNKNDELINELEGGRLFDALDELKLYNDILPKFDLEEFIEIVKLIFKEIRIEKTNLLSDRVYILGTIEASMQSFDKLIICSLNEGSIPKVVKHSIWMPNKLLDDIGFATIEKIIGMTAYDLLTTFGSKKIFMIRSTEIAGVETAPSRWLERYNILTEIQKGGHEIVKNNYYQKVWNKLNHCKEFLPCPKPMPHVSKDMLPKFLGVTDVAKLIKDPYQIYVKNILKLRKINDISERVEASQYGIILHKIYERFQRTALKQKEDFDFDTVGVNIIKEEFLKTYDDDYFYKIILPEILKHKSFVKCLMERNTTKQEFEKEYKALFEYDNCSLQIKAKIDRLEFYLDELTVIDFKSSASNVPDPSKNPQLLITALILQKSVANAKVKQVGLFSFNAINKDSDISKVLKLIDVDKLEKVDKDKPNDTVFSYIEKMDDILENVIKKQMVDNALYYVNDEDDDPYNDYRHFSRIKEWNIN